MQELKVLVVLLSGLLTVTAHCQSNLLVNPSFEKPGLNRLHINCILNDLPDWAYTPNGANRCVAIAPDGGIIVSFSSVLAQDVPTVPGRRYYFKGASQGSFAVQFGDQLVSTLTNIGPTNLIFNQPWYYTYCHLAAVSNVTRLSLVTTQWVNVDDLLLGWLDEPVTLVIPPTDVEVPLGGQATLQVTAQGGPPLSYQWFKDSLPIQGANSAVYFIPNGTLESVGSYSVTVSNPVSSISTDAVQLTINTEPRAPQLTFQPESFEVLIGTYATLRTGAIGTPPVRFQWRMNGTNLPGQTNSVLQFLPVLSEHSGVYDVTVENDHGSAVSLPATVAAKSEGRTGSLIFAGTTFPAFRRPCFDVDGVTPLFGLSYRCQMYIGFTPDRLLANGLSHYFRTNPSLPGLPDGNFNTQVVFPESSTDWTVYYQLRAWEASYGLSYEEARAQGGKVGSSALNSVVVEGPIPGVIIPGLTLRAGLPGFTTGRISNGGRNEEGLIEWELTGAARFTYLIERRQPPNNWFPFVVLSNATGTVTFVDPDQQNQSVSFYRARMLD